LSQSDIFEDQPKGAVLTYEALADSGILREFDYALRSLETPTTVQARPFDGVILHQSSDNSVIHSTYSRSIWEAREPLERVVVKMVDLSMYSASVSRGEFPAQPFALQIRNDRMRIFVERDSFLTLVVVKLLQPDKTPGATRIARAVDRLINRAHYKCTYELVQGVDPHWNQALEQEIRARFSTETEACKLQAPFVRKALNDVVAAFESKAQEVGSRSIDANQVKPVLRRLVGGS